MIEPGLNGGRLDGIGVYTAALQRQLPQAGCTVAPFSYPRWGADPGAISVGQPLPQSFQAATLRDLLTPAAHRMHMPVDIFHAPDYRLVRMDCPVVATLHDALPISHPEWCNPRLRGAARTGCRQGGPQGRPRDRRVPLRHRRTGRCFRHRPTRISVVHNGVDEAWLTPPDRRRRASHPGQPRPARRLLFVCRHAAAAQERRPPAGCLATAAARHARRAPAGDRGCARLARRSDRPAPERRPRAGRERGVAATT